MTDYPLTFKCNNNCISCIEDTDIAHKIPDPNIKKITDVIGKIDPKNDYLGIGGGEPTLRKEFFQILKYARETHPNLFIFITTNGRMFAYKNFTKKLADLKLGNYMVAVALYGPNEEIQDNITKVKNSFNQTVEGIKNLIEFGTPTEVRIVINKINYQYMEDVANLIVKEFQGVDRVVFVNMKITGNAFKNRNEVLVKYKELVSYVDKAVEVLKKNNIKTFLYHFPLCTIPEHLWDIAKGITKTERYELTFVEECEKCRMKKECPMIWKTYVIVAGKEEFKAID